MSEPAPAPSLHATLGMTDEEYAALCRILEREPEVAELAMYSVMWSEHCSYKSSRKHLGRFPSDAPWVVVGPGENAGVVDLGDGWLAAMRIESHNHPSFVEPYQGAATGVGGILRDVFTMGARPIALWDQVRFGSLDDAHNRYLFAGVVAGIAGYGNAVGVPTVGGEVAFEDCYAGNPLVNVMCLGILRRDQLVLGTAGPPGSKAVLLGAATGRDGIGGASVLASTGFDASSSDKRPSVQVGDPFEEKKLIEACLELYAEDLVVGVQDLGAAGLSCATSEPAGRAGTGMDCDLDAVHVREPGMSAAELLMSESQERMMAFVDPVRLDEVLAIADKWEIDASVIGTVTPGNTLRIWHNGEQVAEVPANTLADAAPLYDRPAARPDWLDNLWNTPEPVAPPDLEQALLTLLDDPAIGDPAWVSEQYDHMLFLNTVIGPGGDATLLRLKGTTKGIAVSTDGNGRACYLDPRRGGEAIVYEAALNVALVGARPMAVVDNLNFGNPEKPDVMWQFIETVAGISAACEELSIPVIGGNVSFYNETHSVDIYPTPVIGLMGLADPMPADPPRISGARPGDGLWLVGPTGASNLAGSSYSKVVGGGVHGRPTAPSGERARAVIDAAIALAHDDEAHALHDVSDGGIAVGAAEMAITAGTGVTLGVGSWQELFSEDPHRLLVAAGAKAVLPSGATRIGTFGGNGITLAAAGRFATVTLDDATDAWRNALPRRML